MGNDAMKPRASGESRRQRLRSSLLRRSSAGDEAHESVGGAPTAPEPEKVIQAVRDIAARLPEDERGDPGEFRKALDIMTLHGEPGLKKLFAESGDETEDELFALEAVVCADGSRPALFLKDGEADATHALVGYWGGDVSITRSRVRAVASAVGRVQPANGSDTDYFGTCTVVDSGGGLVLTNHHVMRDMLARARVKASGNGLYRVFDGAYVDFGAEKAPKPNVFRVVEAQASHVVRLDAAVLKIETTKSGQEVPHAVEFTSDLAGPRWEGFLSMCVIGHPALPPRIEGTDTVSGKTIDWGWVYTTLFGRTFGVKRLSPGCVNVVLGSVDEAKDPEKWTFGHDATTLGGNSGSPVIAWKNGGAAFGLHFTGAVLTTNRAHAIGRCADRLRAMGVPVADP